MSPYRDEFIGCSGPFRFDEVLYNTLLGYSSSVCSWEDIVEVVAVLLNGVHDGMVNDVLASVIDFHDCILSISSAPDASLRTSIRSTPIVFSPCSLDLANVVSD
jgi:hypothetical protein